MKQTLLHIFLLLCTAMGPCFLFAQQRAASDSGRRYILQQIVNHARRYSLYRTQVDWLKLQQRVLADSASQLTPVELEQRVNTVFQELGDKHATLLFRGKRIVRGALPSVNIRPELTNPFKKGNPGVRISILENGYAYILIPPRSRSDNKTLQSLQDSLCTLDPVNLKGIVIDLRLHEGGSIYPMAALSQLYGSSIIGFNSSMDGTLQNAWKVKNGKYYQGERLVASVKMKCSSGSRLKVAVLISQLTASAGEVMAVAFKGREHTVFIGEKTYGLSTINSEFDLGNGYYLALSSAFLADRIGRVYNTAVSPDIEIINGDNFADLSLDTKVQAALAWFKGAVDK